MLRRDFIWRAGLLSAGLSLAPNTVWAQEEASGEGGDEAWEPPEANRAGQAAPPAVPDPALSAERAKLMVRALREDQPDIALPFFFPLDEFRHLKAIANPERYFRRLIRIYHEDLKAMRASLRAPDELEFVSFGLGRQKRWVARRKEGNAYPYYASYKCPIVVRDKGKERRLPVRVMISWGDQWYVTHLTNK